VGSIRALLSLRGLPWSELTGSPGGPALAAESERRAVLALAAKLATMPGK